MRSFLFCLVLILGTAPALSQNDLLTKEQAHQIASDMMSQVRQLERPLADLYHSTDKQDAKNTAAAARKQLEDALSPFQQALEQDKANGASESLNRDDTSELSKLSECRQAALALSDYAERIAKRGTSLTSASVLATLYSGYIKYREDCTYQRGEERPPHLQSQEALYRAQIHEINDIMNQLIDLSDTDFINEAKTDYVSWLRLTKPLQWHFRVEQSETFYRLSAMSSKPAPWSEEQGKIAIQFMPCRLLQQFFVMRLSEVMQRMTRNHKELISADEIERHHKQVADCVAVLDSR